MGGALPKSAAMPETPSPWSSSSFFTSRTLFRSVASSSERCGAKMPSSTPSNLYSWSFFTTTGRSMGLSAYPPQMYAQVPTEIFLAMETSLVDGV